jgi:hypothetical protein
MIMNSVNLECMIVQNNAYIHFEQVSCDCKYGKGSGSL